MPEDPTDVANEDADDDVSAVPLEIWLRRAGLFPGMSAISDLERATGMAIQKAMTHECSLPLPRTRVLEDPGYAYRKIVEVQASDEDHEYVRQAFLADVRGVLAQGLRRAMYSCATTDDEREAAAVALVALAALCPAEEWEEPSARQPKRVRVARSLPNHPVAVLDGLAASYQGELGDLLRQAALRGEGTLLAFSLSMVQAGPELIKLLQQHVRGSGPSASPSDSGHPNHPGSAIENARTAAAAPQRRNPGRPRGSSMDPEGDEKIAQKWATRQYSRYKDLAREVYGDEGKADEARMAVDRHRKRKRRSDFGNNSRRP